MIILNEYGIPLLTPGGPTMLKVCGLCGAVFENIELHRDFHGELNPDLEQQEVEL